MRVSTAALVRAMFAVALTLTIVPAAVGQTATPEGRWKTIDDKTGVAKSIVVIRIVNGEVEGTIERVFVPPSKEEHPMCTPCPGEFSGKPVVGMRIMWGLKGGGADYEGGRVFDPDAGKVYRCKIHLVEGGKQLEVRGFIGFSLIGRTQRWERQ